jgi:hypothetical protein
MPKIPLGIFSIDEKINFSSRKYICSGHKMLAMGGTGSQTSDF